MNRRLRKYLIYGGGALLLALAGTAAAVRLIDVDRYRPGIEAAIHEATGLDCSLGKLSLSLWPFLYLQSDHPVLRHAGQPILQAERITASAHLLPLLSRRLEIHAITVTQLTGTIQRDRKGNLNLLPPWKPRPKQPITLPLASLRVAKLVFRNANLRYEDAASGTIAAAKDLNFTVGPFLLVDQGRTVVRSGRDLLAASWNGDLQATTISFNALTLDHPALRFAVAQNTLTAKPVTAALYGGKMEGNVTVADLGPNPQLATACSINDLDLTRLSAALHRKSRLIGRLHVTATLTTSGMKHEVMLRRLNGTVAMQGKRLTLENLDLDTVLTQYAKSQDIGLFELGSIFIVGPFGPLLSKAFDLSGTALGMSRGNSRITQLASDWTIRDGIATTKDVAFATPHHRLAFRGQLDLPAERFRDFRVGVLDQRGCATFTQTINGSFHAPQVEKTSFFARTIVNPLLSLFHKGATALGGDGKTGCTPFYQGRVPHPATP